MIVQLAFNAARLSAPPHHLWYEADVAQIVAAEKHVQNDESTVALIVLATSLQV
jgi:hypothetical protein